MRESAARTCRNHSKTFCLFRSGFKVNTFKHKLRFNSIKNFNLARALADSHGNQHVATLLSKEAFARACRTYSNAIARLARVDSSARSGAVRANRSVVVLVFVIVIVV